MSEENKEIKLEVSSKEYKHFLDHGWQKAYDELKGFFGKQGAGLVLTITNNTYTSYINIHVKRLINNKYRVNTLYIMDQNEDYKALSDGFLKNYKLQIWAILDHCPDEKFKIGNKVYKKQEIIDILKLEDE